MCRNLVAIYCIIEVLFTKKNIMKLHAILLSGILAFSACSKDDDSDSIMTCSNGQKSFSSDNGTKLDVDTQTWYLQRDKTGGGSVNLRIAGSITGDSATLRTYGDGLIFDSEIELNSNKEFNQDVSISFTATTVPEGDIEGKTLIYVYGLKDTLEVELKGCTLRY